MAEKMPKGDAKDYFLRNYWFETYSEIADVTGWSEPTLGRWKHEFDLPKKNERNRIEHTHGVDMERVLYHLHHDAKMSTPEMADALDVHRPQLKKWFDETGVEKRGQKEAERVKYENLSDERKREIIKPAQEAVRNNHASFRTNYNGYEDWRSTDPDGKERMMKVHRLLAVAEFGVEAVKDLHVHHKKNIPWLNTHENICLIHPEDHAREHYQDREIDELGRFE